MRTPCERFSQSLPVTLFGYAESSGPVSKVNGLLSQQRSTVRIVETGKAIPMKTPDQVIVAAEFDSGVLLAFQLRGGLPCGRG
jgi:hypothetical protein